MPPRICHPAQPTLLRSFGLASLLLLPREGFGLRLPAPVSLRRDGPLTQDLRPWQGAEGASMNLRPLWDQQRLPPRGKTCDRRAATSEATVAHGKPYTAANMLRGPVHPRYTLSHPPYHPAPLLSPIRTIPKKKICPIFGVNLRILPIPGARRLPSATPPPHRDLRSLRRDKPVATVASPICDVEVKIRGCVILISDC